MVFQSRQTKREVLIFFDPAYDVSNRAKSLFTYSVRYELAYLRHCVFSDEN